MSKVQLFPYPRLSSTTTKWSEWEVSVDSKRYPLEQVGDHWDANSALSIRIAVIIGLSDLASIQANLGAVQLIAAASCRDTAFTITRATPLVADATTASGSATISIPGHKISQLLELNAYLTSPVDSIATSTSWLDRRIIADGPHIRMPLASELDGFPTVAYSFDKAGIPDAPWRIVVLADHLEAAFTHSVRLELNDDYPLVRDLMDGSASTPVTDELIASITRVLLSTVAKIRQNSTESRSLQELAAEEPDSIVAAAQRAAMQYLKLPIDKAVQELTLRPERLEHLIASGVGILRKP